MIAARMIRYAPTLVLVTEGEEHAVPLRDVSHAAIWIHNGCVRRNCYANIPDRPETKTDIRQRVLHKPGQRVCIRPVDKSEMPRYGTLVGLMAPQGCDRCGDDEPRAAVQMDKPSFGLYLETFRLQDVTPIEENER